jgi:hypothetical protein
MNKQNPYAPPATITSGEKEPAVGYRSGSTLAMLACLALSAFAIVKVLQLAMDSAVVTLGEPSPDGLFELDPLLFEIHSVAHPVVLGLQVLTYLLSALMFGIWVFRANKNARALGAEGMNFSAGGCIGWFFAPFLSFYKPSLAVREVYRASDPQSGADDWRHVRVPAFVGWWWGMWLCALLLSRVESSLSRSNDPESVRSGIYLGLASAPIWITASLLCLVVVRSIDQRQVEKALGESGDNPWRQQAS